ncbi:UNVERIFIED_CONTAM: hypothetical protein PYX00_005425 [Menopon gallinae]|uniref:Uncharacterized protein n=1 Tax=Menopon gallinae TaxID=328185 RepID=A0AAW2HSM8_9NEOP
MRDKLQSGTAGRVALTPRDSEPLAVRQEVTVPDEDENGRPQVSVQVTPALTPALTVRSDWRSSGKLEIHIVKSARSAEESVSLKRGGSQKTNHTHGKPLSPWIMQKFSITRACQH